MSQEINCHRALTICTRISVARYGSLWGVFSGILTFTPKMPDMCQSQTGGEAGFR